MSVSAVVALKPLQSSCAQKATSAMLSLSINSRTTAVRFRTVIRLSPHPTLRHQSTSRSTPSPPNQRTTGEIDFKTRPSKGSVSFGQFLRRALVAGVRNFAFSLSPRGIKQALRQYPTSTSLILAFSVVFWAFIVYLLINFYNAFYNEHISKFPEPVANTLRKALLHAFYRPNPELALRYFKQAMAQCNEIGLDPFSDEVLGIRIIIAEWLERTQHYQTAIQGLEELLSDCNRWLEVFEQTVRDGKVTKEGRLVAAEEKETRERQIAIREGRTPEDVPAPTETMWRKRQRLLTKAISTSIKLGELYASEHILDVDKSHAHLLWAVESSLKEMKRSNEQGIRNGEEKSLMSSSELGGSLESLGNDYERKSQFQFAIPLFFHALRLCEIPCHRAVIMNNLATCFAQQPLFAPGTGELSETLGDLVSGPLPSTRQECLEAAENWAQNAYTHAVDVKGSGRTEECDQACAVSLCNWADVAAMMGKRTIAVKKYRQAMEMSQRLGFEEGVKQAHSGLARLKSE